MASRKAHDPVSSPVRLGGPVWCVLRAVVSRSCRGRRRPSALRCRFRHRSVMVSSSVDPVASDSLCPLLYVVRLLSLLNGAMLLADRLALAVAGFRARPAEMEEIDSDRSGVSRQPLLHHLLALVQVYDRRACSDRLLTSWQSPPMGPARRALGLLD